MGENLVSGSYRFDRFSLDPQDRQLLCDGAPVALNARYLDALALLVREEGRLVTKDRFLEEVWRGVPVTDEALTQCVRTLRRALGDEVGAPRFIETVPKHGYRFVAPVTWSEGGRVIRPDDARAGWPRLARLGLAGTAGGGVAGLLGGLLYGFAGASQPLQPGVGAASVLLVLLALNIAIALIGAAGVAFGIAASGWSSRRLGWWSIVGGAAGGLVVGACVKLVGLDAFNLLFGHAPNDITGAGEGVLLGGAVGFGAWLGALGVGPPSLKRSIAVAALSAGAAGVVIPILGGRLMAGSLDLLARSFPGSRLRFDQIGALVGEAGFGPISQSVTGGLEGLLFGGCIVGAMILAEARRPGRG